MSPKDISDDDLEDELDKAFKENERLKQGCGTAIPESKEIGIQRSEVKLKK